MRTWKNLFSKITSFENLLLAFRAARRGKPLTQERADFEFHLEERLFALQAELINGTYRPAPYRTFCVTEGARRKISAAPFRDRVVHHALHRVIEPLFDREFIFDSYACRVGKGTHRAADRCARFLRRHPYVLKADIAKFFPSVDHAILEDLLARRIRDERTMALIRRILESGVGILDSEYEMRWFPGDDLLARWRPRGLPIGNLTSQFFANVYLHPSDCFVKHALRVRDYLRYVDDFLLFGEDPRTLHRHAQEIGDFLMTLRLCLHPRKLRIFPVRTGVDFVGYVQYPTHRRVRRRSVIQMRRRLRALREGYAAGEVSVRRVRATIQSWLGHAGHANARGLSRDPLGGVAFQKAGRESGDLSDLRGNV